MSFCLFLATLLLGRVCLLSAQTDGRFGSVSVPSGVLPSHGNHVATVTMRIANAGQSLIATAGIGGSALITTETFDGLGRKVGKTAVGGSSAGNLHARMSYDNLGRMSTESLPFVTQGTAYPPTEIPAKTIAYSYEDNVHGRITAVQKADDPSKTLAHAYRLNTTNDNLMRLRADSNGKLVRTDDYAAAALFCTTQTDEDGHSLSEFRDVGGGLMVSRRGDDSSGDTYYVYNSAWQLVYVLPPLATAAMRTHGTGTWSSLPSDVKPYAYRYTYDARGNRTGAYYPPGISMRLTSYNTDGVPTSLSLGGTKQYCTFYICDSLRRHVMTGYVSYGTSVTKLLANGFYTSYNGNTTFFGYASPGSSPTADAVNAVNYYDDYRFLTLYDATGAMQYTPNQACTGERLTTPRGRLTGTVRRVLGTDTLLVKVYYYDTDGRIMQTHETTFMGATEHYYYEYTFTGKPLRIRHVSNRTEYDEQLTVSTLIEYTYDDFAERLLATTTTLEGGDAVAAVTRAYDTLGRLAQKTMGTEAATVSYAYDTSSRLTAIASAPFSQQLYYETDPDGGEGCHNGNIHDVTWKHGTDGLNNRYSYAYDGLNRLTAAHFTGDRRKVAVTTNLGPRSRYVERDYSTTYAYDLHDNLTALTRHGYTGTELMLTATKPTHHATLPTYGLTDSLTVVRTGNRVTKVTDHAPEQLYYGANDFCDGSDATTEYVYNWRGNITRDANRGITGITYNCLDQPTAVSFTSGQRIEYTYDADGNRLRAVYKTTPEPVFDPVTGEQTEGTDELVTELQRDYCHGRIYEDGERVYETFGEGFIDDTNTVHYYVHDYLGNVRAVVREDGTVVEEADYYPYGLRFPDKPNATGISTRVQPYTTTGKELDTHYGLNWLNFGTRQYMADLGQWNRVDDLCEEYYPTGPYVYCGANPVKYIDPDGREKLNGLGKIDEKSKSLDNLYNQFDDATDVIVVFAHGVEDRYGNISSFNFKSYDSNTKNWQSNYISNGKEFDKMLTQHSNLWNKYKNGKLSYKPKIILYSCNTSELAKFISQNKIFEGIDFIAPNADVEVYPNHGIYYPVLHNRESSDFGEWITYRNGRETIINGRYTGRLDSNYTSLKPGTKGFKYEWSPF